MLLFSRFSRICPLAISAIFMLQLGGKVPPTRVSQQPESSTVGKPIGVVIWTDHGKYSQLDTLKLSVSLQNSGDAPTYVDRRMFWGGFGSGLKMEIINEHGKPVPARAFSDAIMPPPKEGDTSILIRLDEGFFYGTSLNLRVGDFFTKPGRYSIRVIYKSWLRKEFVVPELRNLPAVWADTPQIASAPVWVDIAQ